MLNMQGGFIVLYKKKRKTGRVVVLLCGILLFAGFTYGYMSNNKPLNKPQNTSKLPLSSNNNYPGSNIKTRDDEKVNNEDSQETIENKEANINETMKVVNEESKIVFNTLYLKTGKTDTKKVEIPVTIVGANLNQFKEYIEDNYRDWEIKGVSLRTASLYKEIDGYNPNYFIIQNKDGYIAVYKINKEGKKEVYEVTDISISTLSEMDKLKLDKGIIAKNLEELYRIIEGYSN
jgi:hypothetical protein